MAEKGKIYVQTFFLETPPKNLGGEKSGVNVLGQNSVRCDFNGSDLSTTEINRVVSSKQRKKTNPIEPRLDFDRLKSRSSAEVNHFIFRSMVVECMIKCLMLKRYFWSIVTITNWKIL